MKKPVLFILLLSLFNISYSQNDISFLQKDKNKIYVRYTDDFESLEVKNSKTGKTQIIKDIEASITGKDSHLVTNDYNFDGFADFASFHTDEGMGVYSIYQVFIFNPKTQQFEILELPTNFESKCDMFCDIKVDKTKKTLTSSCRGGARTHYDIWKYDHNKKLILSKTESD